MFFVFFFFFQSTYVTTWRELECNAIFSSCLGLKKASLNEKVSSEHKRTAEAQIRLRICAVWSGPSLSAMGIIAY